jgi:Asp-tRNA(Asn)/Glu-tRNA(Gln) amidotransferase A subunit family amidase
VSESRREFLSRAGAALLAPVVVADTQASPAATSATAVPAAMPPEPPLPPGSPPVTGSATPVGPPVDAATFSAAENLVQVELSAAERVQAAQNWRSSMAALYERRTGPRRIALGTEVVPYSTCNPLLPGHPDPPRQARFMRSTRLAGALPTSESDIALAPLWQLSRWVEARQLSSERLTGIYLERIAKFDARLRCVVTLTQDFALAQARQADREIAAGRYRGPLHGIPWGGKDLLDTAGIRTTYGAEPYRDRIPTEDAAVVGRLHEAGAVMVAKLSLGALALNDVWFGGQTMNPWVPEEGASGSSAGPGAATAAGLVGFAVGSETEGSIVSPSMRCGITGLRPTFGRVPRSGAMTLCWSLDKLGPMARSVEDTMLVLRVIAGADPKDLWSVSRPLEFDARAGVGGLRAGYFPAWMHEEPATEVDRHALEVLNGLGIRTVGVSLPDWPYDCLNTILFAESAAAFEELTLSHGVDALKMQTPDAWPNSFRQSRFLSAVDFVQADRMRRAVAEQMQRLFNTVDLLVVPSLRDEMLTIGNFTGHPALTLRAGFVEISEPRSDWTPDPGQATPRFAAPRRVPHGVTLIGRLFDEGTIARVGLALEQRLGIAGEPPPGFT